MTQAEAEAAPERNAITQCLGAGAEPLTIHTSTVALEPDACLLLCSDGLWKYAADADQLGALARPRAHEGPLAVARRLVAYANTQGGVDNITAALLFPLGRSSTAQETPV